jgi:hypothetical protein
MATWESLRGYIKSKYKIAQEDQDAIGLVFGTEGERARAAGRRSAWCGRRSSGATSGRRS